MHLVALEPDAAVGHILRHHLVGADGRKQLGKGRRLTRADAALLRELGIEQVRVAVLAPEDLHEDEAARRIAAALGGSGLVTTTAAAGRVNLLAASDGVLRIDTDRLAQINDLDGVAVATLATDRLVRQRERVATVKIIPFALPEVVIARAERLVWHLVENAEIAARRTAERQNQRGQTQVAERTGAVIRLDPLQPLAVGVLLVGGEGGRVRLDHGLAQAIAERVTALGSTVLLERAAAFDEATVAQALRELRAAGAELVIVAGETSIMDAEDIVPTGVRLAGGQIEHYGAPVEPGNLLLLAYLADGTPVLGAPGCVRSRDLNIVDLILPRLLAGERLTRSAIIALGHGGLLH